MPDARRKHTSKRLGACFIWTMAALASATPTAWAQGARPTRSAASEPAPSVELAPTPYDIKSMGVSLRFPVGSKAQAQRLGTSEASVAVFAPDGSWRILVRTTKSKDTTLTPLAAVQAVLKQLQIARAVRDQRSNKVRGSSVQTLVEPATLDIAGAQAARFYTAIPRLNETPAVSGYTIVRMAPGRFFVAEFDCALADFDAARPVYERVMNTLHISDQSDRGAGRAALLLSGDTILASLDRDKIESILPKQPIWWRQYRPAQKDQAEKEIGYQRVETHVGQRGELDPRRPKSRWSVEDREFGFVASVMGRFLDGERIVDSQSIFFLSFDLSRESWVVRMTVREGDSKLNWSETGVREGDDIKVTADQPGSNPIVKHWKKPPRAYLSQVEVYLTPRILINAGAEAMFGFYRYLSALNDIALRRDTLRKVRKDDQAPTDAIWALETRSNDDAGVSVMFMDAHGAPIERRLPNNTRMTPMTLADLKRLWRSKGLPMS